MKKNLFVIWRSGHKVPEGVCPSLPHKETLYMKWATSSIPNQRWVTPWHQIEMSDAVCGPLYLGWSLSISVSVLRSKCYEFRLVSLWCFPVYFSVFLMNFIQSKSVNFIKKIYIYLNISLRLVLFKMVAFFMDTVLCGIVIMGFLEFCDKQ